MKNLLVLFLFSLFSLNAKADVIFCAISGDVLLQVKQDTVVGRIGVQDVSLSRYQNSMYGEIAGLPADLRFYGRHVVGTIGTDNVHWDFNRGGFITGTQSCIYDIINKPVYPEPVTP
jgi:hypothetical protein